jgi:SAM-dependent methyltransferase
MDYNIGDTIHSDTPCKLCGQHELKVVATLGRNYQSLTTTLCTGCGLVHSYPIPTAEELEEYYRKQYRSEYKMAYTPQRKHILRYSRNGLERLSRLLPFTPNRGKLLDIGSGSGEFVYLAKLAGFDVTGLEPHEGYSRYTRETFEVPITSLPLEKADIPAESVDVITLHHVLEHLRFPLTSLGIMNRWLKPGGVLMIDVPDIENTSHSPTNRFHYAHIYNFNHATLKGFLQKAGFTVEEGPHQGKGTILAARKVGGPDLSLALPMPENAAHLWQLLTQENMTTHYTKATPYQKFLRKLRHYPVEFVEAMLVWSPRRIVRREFERWRQTRSLSA